MNEFFKGAWGDVSEWFREHFLVALFTLAIGFLLYKFGGKLISKIVEFFVRSAKHKTWAEKDIEKRQKTLNSIIGAVWKVVVTVVLVTTLITQLFPAVNLTGVLAGLGVVSIAIGLGAQSLVKDFLAGFFIVSENQYRVGDVVELANGGNGASGTVEKVNARTTVLRDQDGNVHFVANGSIVRVTNKTMGYSRSRFEVKVAYDNNLKNVVEIINEVGRRMAEDVKWEGKILQAPEFVEVSDFDGGAITLAITGKTLPSDQWEVMSDMRQRLIDEFKVKRVKLV